MAYTYEQLRSKTVVELRDIAQGISHEAVRGYSQMNKEHLLPALCTALGIDTHEHHAVVGIDKAGIKAKIRELKRQRDAAIEASDPGQLKVVRRHIHHLNHRLRSHAR
jgi:hypothetical protein